MTMSFWSTKKRTQHCYFSQKYIGLPKTLELSLRSDNAPLGPRGARVYPVNRRRKRGGTPLRAKQVRGACPRPILMGAALCVGRLSAHGGKDLLLTVVPTLRAAHQDPPQQNASYPSTRTPLRLFGTILFSESSFSVVRGKKLAFETLARGKKNAKCRMTIRIKKLRTARAQKDGHNGEQTTRSGFRTFFFRLAARSLRGQPLSFGRPNVRYSQTRNPSQGSKNPGF